VSKAKEGAADADEKDSDEVQIGPLLGDVLIEETASSGDDTTGGGLELDAQQAAEIRRIFLTSLPDYLVPMKEMVARLSAEPDETGEIRGGLAKTIASVAAAAARMKLDDVTKSMEALREDVVLFGDPSEPQEALRERITSALGALERLAGSAGSSVRPESRSETLVAVLQGAPGIDNAILQKLLAAGVVYVDQVLEAEPKEVAMVSGLDANTVAMVFRALKERRDNPAASRAAPPAAASAPNASVPPADYSSHLLGLFSESDSAGRASQRPRASAAPLLEVPDAKEAASLLGRLDAKDTRGSRRPSRAAPDTRAFDALFGAPPRAVVGAEKGPLADRLRRQADDELALEEARGRATRVRSKTEELRDEMTAIERECTALRAAISDTRSRAAARLAALARVETKRAAIDRDLAATLAETEKVASRLTTLQAERRTVVEELASLTDGTASVTESVTRVLETHESRYDQETSETR
jgi:hypothetical protein